MCLGVQIFFPSVYVLAATTFPHSNHHCLKISQNQHLALSSRGDDLHVFDRRKDTRLKAATSGGYPRVSVFRVSGLGLVFRPRFSSSGLGLVSGSVSGFGFHPWISNGYSK